MIEIKTYCDHCGKVLDDGFSSACEELASNIDELRKFAEGGVIDGKHKQNT